MANSGFYEETIVLKDVKLEEINRYYISDDITIEEKIAYILKKGYPLQRCALINLLPDLVQEYEQLNFILSNVIESIELWDKSIQFSFAKALNKTVQEISRRQIRGKNYEGILHMIIFHYLKSIVGTEKITSDEYVIEFNELVGFLSAGYRIPISHELIDYSISLGKFGQSVSNRKFSVYFCVCLLRISDSYNEDLHKRFIILCGDAERVVKNEIAYQIRYTLQELDETCIRKQFYSILDSYLKDNDLLFKSEVIVSILMNILKFDSDFVKNLINVLEYMFVYEDHFTFTYEFNHYIKIFSQIIQICILHSNVLKGTFIGVVKTFINKYYFNYNNDTISNSNGMSSNSSTSQQNLQLTSVTFTISFKYDYIIEKFPQIAQVLKNNGETNFLIDIFNYMMKQIFDNGGSMTSSNWYKQKSISGNQLDYPLLFFKNFHQIAAGLNKFILNKNALLRFFQILNDPELGYVFPDLLKTWDKIFIAMAEIDNEDFFNFFFSEFSKIETRIKEIKEWRTIEIVLRAFRLIIEYLSQEKYSHEEFFGKITQLVKYYIHDGHHIGKNLTVQVEIIKLFTRLIKYSRTFREELLQFTKGEFFLNKSFYQRRLYLVFIDESFEYFSVGYLKEAGIFDNFLQMFDDNPLILCGVLKTLPKIFPLVFKDEALNEKLDKINEDVHMKNIKDTELIKSIQSLNEWIEVFKIKAGNGNNYAFRDASISDTLKYEDEQRIKDKESIVLIQQNAKKEKPRKLSIKKTLTNPTIAHISNGSGTSFIPALKRSGQNKLTSKNYTSNNSNLPVINKLMHKSDTKVVAKSFETLKLKPSDTLREKFSQSFKFRDVSNENPVSPNHSIKSIRLETPRFKLGNTSIGGTMKSSSREVVKTEYLNSPVSRVLANEGGSYSNSIIGVSVIPLASKGFKQNGQMNKLKTQVGKNQNMK